MMCRTAARTLLLFRAAAPTATGIMLLLAACRHQPTHGTVPSPGRETVITESEIRAFGAGTAWDLVRAKAPRLVAARDEQGRPTGVRIQESRSVNADETPLLIVDGAQTYDLSWLAQIPVSELTLVRILDAEAAQPLYGLRAAGGAIEVTTKGNR